MEKEIVIIGAGPAGLSAAAEFHRHGYGRSVTIIEREEYAGGIPRHCGHRTFGLREFGRLMTGPDYAKRMNDQIGDGELETGVTVLNIDEKGSLRITGKTKDGAMGERIISARHILLCTGTRETPFSQRPIGGNRVDGIMNTARLQQQIYLYGEKPDFSSPIILGGELVAFSAILTLSYVGIQPRALIEENSSDIPFMDWAARIFYGVPILSRTKILGTIGKNKLEAIHIDRGFGPEEIKCDALILSGQFRPENALLMEGTLKINPQKGPQIDHHWRCSNPIYYSAGNILGDLRTAGNCWRQGKEAAQAIIKDWK